MNKNSIKELSIQINLNGLSFCILNRTSNTIEHLYDITFDKKCTPFEVLKHLDIALENNEYFDYTFKSVQIIYQNELFSLVPKSLFNENHLADYLKFNTKILKTDFISFDEIIVNDSVCVYVPLVNINNYIFEKFGAFEYKHIATVLISEVLQKPTLKDKQLFINVSENSFEIIATNNSSLELYNSFEYQTKEDFIYYILFTMEQLKYDPETAILKLSGVISKDDSLYAILYKYIRHIEFNDVKHHYNFKESLEQKHNHYAILNSFS